MYMDSMKYNIFFVILYKFTLILLNLCNTHLCIEGKSCNSQME